MSSALQIEASPEVQEAAVQEKDQEGPVARGTRFAPALLISEGMDGQIVFAEGASTAPSRSREQARLFYEQGIKETRLINARRWRDVHSQHSVEEIGRAEAMVSGIDLIKTWDMLKRELKREEQNANPNPFRLQSLDAEIHHRRLGVETAEELIASASERERALVQTLQDLSKRNRRARGWKLKAERQIACSLYGMQYDGGKCGRMFFCPFYCQNRYCPICGPQVHKRLVEKYLRLEKLVADFLAKHPSYRVRILDLTAVKRSDRMPSSDDVHKFKADVKRLVEAVNRHVADKLGAPCSKQLTGYLYCLEFGFENNNLHCHGLLISPYVEQDWISDEWRKIRNDGSFRVFIAEAYSFEAAIKHALEYTGKYAAPSAERAFELELAFVGCRRVDTLGWFFNRLPKEDFSADLSCPCGDPECFVKPNRELGWLPLSYFEQRRIPCLHDAQRNRPPTSRKEVVSWVS